MSSPPVTASASRLHEEPQPHAAQDLFAGQARQWARALGFAWPAAPVLHPSPLRMKALGWALLVGHPLCWLIWAVWLPQPYESLSLRLFAASLGLLLLSRAVSEDAAGRAAGLVFSAVMWFALPFVSSYLYLCNGGSAVWLAGMAATILACYAVTDWRIASLGLALAAVAAKYAFDVAGATAVVPDGQWPAHAVVLGASAAGGLLLALSCANARRERLRHAATALGVLAHELRTPLGTLALIGDAMRTGVPAAERSEAEARQEELAMRLHALLRNMHRQIDAQIANTRLLQLPRQADTVSAAGLVREVLRNYPYRSTRERDAVVLQVRRDFQFRASQAPFAQALENLLKNAFRSLAAAAESTRPGGLLVEVGALHGRGCIHVTDKGVGIEPALHDDIFEPFFTTHKAAGHGLGLAFCRRVAEAAGGSIKVRSAPGRGATFTIELPMLG